MTAIDAPQFRSRIEWQVGRVQAIVAETSRVKSIVLQPTRWPGHQPGQHVDIRLTAEDGYRAERSYSIASPPTEELIMLTVERIEDGEVSSYLLDELQIGDALEFRGPIGGHFIWNQAANRPLCLVAGGSGVTPLMAMLRHRRASRVPIPASLIYSARCLNDIVYRDELDAMSDGDADLRVIYALTRECPRDWTGHKGRVDELLLAKNSFAREEDPLFFVCGPAGFVESISSMLVKLDFDPLAIKTERFGPSGG
ncbi:ferredoxin reductase [Bradyrhizobium sp. WYCCWR 13022]|uniref:ferredoxin reductase n=1 Tax=unclassified Bradyrhizobium TaxID=2631580 RepID=UPI00263B492B|nr:ferredoxin reductase [Bradyrhizobium sp. WYCCWR 13022]MDN4985601.1 ferredoxin reductase [Bradyrhizobium sp. WYCCWR 13022]